MGKTKKISESQRLHKLHDLMVLDSLPEPLFDEITQFASQICGVPIALISLVDENRQWFKANVGLAGASETPRDISFCTHAIQNDVLMEIPNATKDKRFKDNPLVTGDPNIRFYAGMPIKMADGSNIGTLCVIDRKPHALNNEQKAMLTRLANVTAKALAFRADTISEIDQHSTRLNSVIDNSADAIITKTLDGIVTTWNHSAERIFGYAATDIIGTPITRLFPEDRLYEEDDFISKIKNNKRIEHYETKRITKSGKVIDISVSLSPIKDLHGKTYAVSKIARDITHIKALQDAIADEHRRLTVTLDSIGDGVITTDATGKVEYLNPIAEALTKWQTSEAKGKSLTEVFNIINEQTRSPATNPVERCIKENRIVSLEAGTILVDKLGNEYAIEDSAAPIRNNGKEVSGVVLVFHDATLQREMAREIDYRATHDHLTGLINRAEFEKHITALLKKKQGEHVAHALMFIDLDQFKIINDTSGHAAGDALLTQISKVMGSCIRTTDIFARIGGDEFAIILPKCSLEKALAIGNMLCKAVGEYRLNFEGQKFSVSTSIGLVMIDHTWQSMSDLLKAADNACYAAKSDGRNRVHLHHQADSAISARLNEALWARRVEVALEENQFNLYFQRIQPLAPNEPSHAEVLIRIIDDDNQLINPGQFIPAAERFNMMPKIDLWVIKETMGWIKQHKHALNHIDSISINLSGQSLNDTEFHQAIYQLIGSEAIDASKLCFEITETAAITNVIHATAFINDMKQAFNVKFSLDDFGSGASSFGYLKNLPVDYLKIDGQFIKDLADDEISQATVKCIVEVAKVTNKKTIAEWVDNIAVQALLKSMGVDYVQGFSIHKPAPLSALLDMESTQHN